MSCRLVGRDAVEDVTRSEEKVVFRECCEKIPRTRESSPDNTSKVCVTEEVLLPGCSKTVSGGADLEDVATTGYSRLSSLIANNRVSCK